MKNFIKENWFRIIIFLIIISAFIWFEWRPSQIKQHCTEQTEVCSGNSYSNKNYKDCVKFIYEICLTRNGL